MTVIIHAISCVLAVVAAVALFVLGLFIQSGIDAASMSPIVLFGLSIVLFVVANYYGWLIRDHYVESQKLQHQAGKRIR